MKKPNLIKVSRRDLLTKVMPACALTCIGAKSAFAALSSEDSPNPQQAKHKFDKEFKLPRSVSLKQYKAEIHKGTIELAKTLVKELGEKKAIEILQKNIWNRYYIAGQNSATRAGDNSFKRFTSIFRNPRWNETLTLEIVEDTEKAFQLKITECIDAEVFKAANFAGELGHACYCYEDYGYVEGFNPKIKLERTKTLMQGHDCCNHRYVWTG